MIPPPACTGFILVGGASSRMGREKAWLPVGRQALIELVIRRVRPHVQRLLIVANARNACQFERRLVAGVLVDLKPTHGPLMGIYTGLMHTETPLNLFVPCDMPWIDGALIARLRSACRERVRAVASLHPLEGMQPFPMVCHRDACGMIGALLDRQERTVQALFHQPGTRLVRIDEPELWRSFTNVNTLSDYAKLYDAATLAS